jgi:hypothetical protein
LTVNIVCTSKPVDGLLYYSYEYCSALIEKGVDARVVVICHRKFNKEDYVETLKNKYIHVNSVVFDDFIPLPTDVTLVMGRSMITLSWQDFKNYKQEQKDSLTALFKDNVISVYSENHPAQYPIALEFYNPKNVIDLCDREVYENGVGDHFEKLINFSIYKPHKDDIKFKHLFLGTNEKYYAAAEKVIDRYPNHGILTYNANYINIKNNNVFVPVNNLIGMFESYVYTKETFDPAPRLIQECKHFGKEIIYLRDKTIKDGGSVYWSRDIKAPDVSPIVRAMEKLL